MALCDSKDMDEIIEIEPTRHTLVDQAYPDADYRDAFHVGCARHDFATVGDFATAYFMNQPRWLSLVSMNISSRDKLEQALGDHSFSQGSQVGSWKVHGRTDDEILFGDNMGFMEYRFSFTRRADGDIEASTAVKYRWRRLSHLYFTLVKPAHKRFVPISLRGALRANRPVAT